jgi:hypothetical protein
LLLSVPSTRRCTWRARMRVRTKEEDDKRERRWNLMGFRRIFQMGYRDRFKLEQRAALLGKKMTFWNLQLTKRYREIKNRER